MADEISTTGKWVDTQTGRVVDSEPAEGRLLVAPGGVITPDVAASIARAVADQPPVVETAVEPRAEEQATEPEFEDTAAPAAKETATTGTPRKRTASK